MVRVHRMLPLFAALALFGFGLAVAGDAMAERGGKTGDGKSYAPAAARARQAEPYRAGPLEQRAETASIDWPRGGRELLALGVIAAILYGFRASGLAQQSSRRRSSNLT